MAWNGRFHGWDHSKSLPSSSFSSEWKATEALRGGEKAQGVIRFRLIIRLFVRPGQPTNYICYLEFLLIAVQLAVDTETGQRRLRLCGNNQEKCQGCVKYIRPKRKSWDNEVVSEKGVNIKLESTFSNGMCSVSASRSTKKDSWKRQYRPRELRSRGTGERRIMLKSNISSCGKWRF